MDREQYVIGLDFGTDSVRAILVNTKDGTTASTKVHVFERWSRGEFCDPRRNQYRQHVLDHLEGIEICISAVLLESGIESEDVKGICVDTTGSSPIAVDQTGTPLCLLEEFEDNPNAMVVLWKDHTAIDEAAEINRLAKGWGGEDYTRYSGGVYSSEWFWAKILHIIREDSGVRAAAHSWIEHCDLITYLLIGSPGLDSIKRSRCAAGHKAMWHESWGGLPSEAFLFQLDPDLARLREYLYSETFTSDQVAGNLSENWARKLGLSTDTVITVGTFDAHAGAVGAGIEDHTLVRVMGTSTCDIIVSSNPVFKDRCINGICGQVDGSVLPGCIGFEAGQSAFGDLLAWFRDVVYWPIDHVLSLDQEEKSKVKEALMVELSSQAENVAIAENGPVALDWINGRRTPDANQHLKTAIMNLNLGTKAPEIFRALVESICFGARMIVERFEAEGVRIDSVLGIGGVAKKSNFIVQTLADVLQKPIKVATSDQAPALGAAMYAATAARIYKDLDTAIRNMNSGVEREFTPRKENKKIYDDLFRKYMALGQFVENGETI